MAAGGGEGRECLLDARPSALRGANRRLHKKPPPSDNIEGFEDSITGSGILWGWYL